MGEVEFWPHGLPKKIYVAPLRKEECNAAAQAILLMASASDDGRKPFKTEILLTLFDADALNCREDLDLTSGDAASGGVRLVRGRIIAPKLVTKAEPLYPEGSRRQGHKGVSLYEALIMRNGCVGDLRLVRSSYPELDVAGMDAIAHWRYTPATLDGSPVRVYLTVTVTFALR